MRRKTDTTSVCTEVGFGLSEVKAGFSKVNCSEV